VLEGWQEASPAHRIHNSKRNRTKFSRHCGLAPGICASFHWSCSKDPKWWLPWALRLKQCSGSCMYSSDNNNKATIIKHRSLGNHRYSTAQWIGIKNACNWQLQFVPRRNVTWYLSNARQMLRVTRPVAYRKQARSLSHRKLAVTYRFS